MTGIRELTGRAAQREVVRTGDARSGATFERLVIDGGHYFLKRVSPRTDWVMRVTGDCVYRTHRVWEAGVMHRVPPCIDHAVVAVEVVGVGAESELWVLMRDVAADLVPEGDAPVPMAQHAGFIAHLAELSASFWGWTDNLGLSTMGERVRYFAPDTIAPELARDQVPPPVAAAERGWQVLTSRSPGMARVARAVQDDPELVTRPLASTPVTFLQGDWKMGNLGTDRAGRTILLDWAYPGSGPPCWDLCWYLALNRRRLPEPKEAALARFQGAVEAQGIATRDWWEEQIDLCLVGIMATFAWEKALGDEVELRWWEERVTVAVRRSGMRLPRAPR